jgi:NADH-quinone oxidoreductase subunit J
MTFEPATLFAIFFYAFAGILVVAALQVITSRNPVNSALFLMLSFFCASGLWMLMRAEFLSLVLILVYVGAVMVLFLFVVMMLDLDLDHLRKDFQKYLPVASLVGAIIVAEMAIVLIRGFIGTTQPVATLSPEMAANNTKALGILLYSTYLFSFEVAGVILLVGIVAAVSLTLRRRKDTKTQDIAEQIRTRKEDRVRIVTSMSSDSSSDQQPK